MLVSLTFNTQLFDLEDELRKTLEQYFQGRITATDAQLALGVSAVEFFGLLGTTFQIAQRSRDPIIALPTNGNRFMSPMTPHPPEIPQPCPANMGSYALRFLSSNWPRIAGFAYREYQDCGRGCVLLDCFCCWGVYIPKRDLSLHLKANSDAMVARLCDRATIYHPDQEFVYAIGSLDQILNASTAGIFTQFMDRQTNAEMIVGSLLPTISPPNCSVHWLAPDHVESDDRNDGFAMLRCIPPQDSFFIVSP